MFTSVLNVYNIHIISFTLNQQIIILNKMWNPHIFIYYNEYSFVFEMVFHLTAICSLPINCMFGIICLLYDEWKLLL